MSHHVQRPTVETLFRHTPEEIATANAPIYDPATGYYIGPDDSERYTGPNAPRSPLAEYVLDFLPADLAAAAAAATEQNPELTYENLKLKHEQILQHYAKRIAGIDDPMVARETLLDLAFMRGSYLHPEGRKLEFMPSLLVPMMDFIAARFDLPAYMDYELIIDVNSQEYERTGRMRTYLTGEAGLSERDFYYGHHLSAPHVNQAAQSVLAVITEPGVNDTTQLLTNAVAHMRAFEGYMKTYMRLDMKHFESLRDYLGTFPDGTRNASGAFMPGVQLLDLTLDRPTEEFEVFLRESVRYMPRWSRGPIEQQLGLSRQGHNLYDLTEARVTDLDEHQMLLFQQIADSLANFRMAHKSATYKQVPGDFEERTRGPVPRSRGELMAAGEQSILGGGAIGTAGFNLRNILVGTTSRTLKLADRIKALRLERFGAQA